LKFCLIYSNRNLLVHGRPRNMLLNRVVQGDLKFFDDFEVKYKDKL